MPSLVQTSGSNRGFDHLLVIRGALCLWVVFNHSFGILPPPQWRGLWKNGETDLTWLVHWPAWIGVWGFFVLSGYLMGKAFYSSRYSHKWRGAVSFYKNRILRIIPLYYFITFIACVFVTPEIFKLEFPIETVRIFAFLYDGNFHINPVGSTWSISTEVQFYLLVPLIYFCLKIVSRSANTAFLTILAIVISSLMLRWHFFSLTKGDFLQWLAHIYKPVWMNLDFFISGFLTNVLVRSVSKSRIAGLFSKRAQILRFLAYALFLVFMAADCWICYPCWILGDLHARFLFMVILPAATMIVMTSLICVFELTRGTFKLVPVSLVDRLKEVRNQPTRIFEILGILTYGIFVWHVPILIRIAPVITNPTPLLRFLSIAGLVLSISALLAACTYHFIEFPFETKKKFEDAPATNAAAP